MWTRSERVRFVWTLCVLAAIQAVGTGTVLASRTAADHASSRQSHAIAQPVSRAVEPSAMDALRADASVGDVFAGQALVAQLLDRYERDGDTDELYEAVQWMDREWSRGVYQSTGLPTHVFERYCDHRVLRWHWLCDAGE